VVKDSSLRAKIILVLVTAALLALAGLLAVVWLPRWWAQRVGDVVDGRMSTGIVAGILCGLVFTLIPLLLLRRVFTRRGSLGSRVAWLVSATVLAAPNLTTLGIVLGDGDAAHAGQRILDVEAPAFRTASAIGAVVAAVLAVMWWALMASRRRHKRQIAQLQAGTHDRDDKPS
jgi:MFS family permease